MSLIGEIAVGWAETEESIRELLWLYLGTDRPTFEIIVGKQRTADLERLLRELVERKEPKPELKRDVLIALERVAILRENRNKTLHGTTPADMVVWPLADLNEVRDQIADGVPYLKVLCRRAYLLVVSRDVAETPIGEESFPGDEYNEDYLPIGWPAKPRKIDPWCIA